MQVRLYLSETVGCQAGIPAARRYLNAMSSVCPPSSITLHPGCKPPCSSGKGKAFEILPTNLEVVFSHARPESIKAKGV